MFSDLFPHFFPSQVRVSPARRSQTVLVKTVHTCPLHDSGDTCSNLRPDTTPTSEEPTQKKKTCSLPLPPSSSSSFLPSIGQLIRLEASGRSAAQSIRKSTCPLFALWTCACAAPSRVSWTRSSPVQRVLTAAARQRWPFRLPPPLLGLHSCGDSHSSSLLPHLLPGTCVYLPSVLRAS